VHEGDVLVGFITSEVFEGEGHHGGCVVDSDTGGIVLGILEPEVGFQNGCFAAAVENAEDPGAGGVAEEGEEVAYEADAGVVGEGEACVEVFFGVY
jgi:hypothetical protein